MSLTFDQMLALFGLATPFLLVMIKQTYNQTSTNKAQTAILMEHTALLKELLRMAADNEKTHIKRENLCAMADDSFRRGLVEDVGKALS